MGRGRSKIGGKKMPSVMDKSYSEYGYKMFDAEGSTAEKQADDFLGYGNGGETDRWLGEITSAEQSALTKYTGSYYVHLNEAMRNDEGLTTTDKNAIKKMESAMDKYELKETMVFTRGSSADLLGGADTVEAINAKIGQVVQDKAFMSTAAAGTGFGGITYHILTPPGKGIGAYVKPISKYKSEKEFLFNHGSAFEIKGAYTDDYGLLHCNLRYIGRS